MPYRCSLMCRHTDKTSIVSRRTRRLSCGQNLSIEQEKRTRSIPPVIAIGHSASASSSISAPVLPSAPADLMHSVAAPILAHAVASADLTRALHECLAAPKLMSAEEYRATYPGFDGHNEDYMTYRARWETAEREARESAQGMPGALPTVSSRSLLCTPQRETRTISGPSSGTSVLRAGGVGSAQSERNFPFRHSALLCPYSPHPLSHALTELGGGIWIPGRGGEPQEHREH